MDKWFYFHKKTIKRIGLTVTIIALVFYAFLVWDINYLFKRNYFDEGFRDVALNEPFEYCGMELNLKGFTVYTSQQLIERYGNSLEDMYDMEGNTVSVESVDSRNIYVIVNYDMKKLVENPNFDMTDIIIYDGIAHGSIDARVRRLIIGDNPVLLNEMKVGEIAKDRSLAFSLSSMNIEEKDFKDPSKDVFFLAFPAYKENMKPLRIILK